MRDHVYYTGAKILTFYPVGMCLFMDVDADADVGARVRRVHLLVFIVVYITDKHGHIQTPCLKNTHTPTPTFNIHSS